MLDQQPCPAVARTRGPSARCVAAARARVPTARAHEDPRPLQLVAVQRELEVALLERRIHIGALRRPRAAVPEHHDACAVAFGNHALEFTVLERMILDAHREPLRFRIERGALGDGPRQQYAVVLETKVVMQMAGQVLLHAEEPVRRALRFDAALGLGRLREIAFAAVFLERHVSSSRRPSVAGWASAARTSRAPRRAG